MRLRCTADPSFFVTVNPNLTRSADITTGDIHPIRVLASSTKVGVDHRNPLRTLRNSERRCKVTRPRAGVFIDAPRSSRQALTTFGTTTRKNPQATDSLATLAKAVTALTNELARLIGTFHDTQSPDRLADPTSVGTGHDYTSNTTVPDFRNRGARCLRPRLIGSLWCEVN